MKTNAQNAFENYKMWLKSYPGDYKGAIEAASDFIETQGDVTELSNMVKTQMAA
jgi:hypothetical protein